MQIKFLPKKISLDFVLLHDLSISAILLFSLGKYIPDKHLKIVSFAEANN